MELITTFILCSTNVGCGGDKRLLPKVFRCIDHYYMEYMRKIHLGWPDGRILSGAIGETRV